MDNCIENTLKGRRFKKVCELMCDKLRKKYDFKQIDLDILYYIYGANRPISSGEICKNLILNKGQVSLSMDRLKEGGYLISKQDEKDKRVFHFTLTTTGTKVAKEIHECSNEITKMILEGITKEEIETLTPIIMKFFDNMDKIYEKEMKKR